MNLHNWLRKKLTGICYSYLRNTPHWSHPQAEGINHARILPYASYAPWIDDERFQYAYSMVKKHTLIDIYRLYELWITARQLSAVDGDFLEVGVWRGGSGCLLALASEDTNKKVFLADTFTGVVKASARDTNYLGGEHADTSIEYVRNLLLSCGVARRTQILLGSFPEENANIVSDTLALVHIDVDVYASARDILNWVLPRLAIGGVVILDDYGFYGCEGITALVNELNSKSSTMRFIHNLNGHAILMRII